MNIFAGMNTAATCSAKPNHHRTITGGSLQPLRRPAAFQRLGLACCFYCPVVGQDCAGGNCLRRAGPVVSRRGSAPPATGCRSGASSGQRARVVPARRAHQGSGPEVQGVGAITGQVAFRDWPPQAFTGAERISREVRCRNRPVSSTAPTDRPAIIPIHMPAGPSPTLKVR